MRRGICIVLGLLAAPAAAQADSVSISAPAEGVVGAKSTIAVTVEVSGGGPRDLRVTRKRVEDAPCAASDTEDDAASRERRFVGTQFQIGPGTHTYTYEVEWAEKPGAHRFCAWVQNNQSPYETTAVAPEARIDVRPPRASIAFTATEIGRFWVNAGEITTSVTPTVAGTREMRSSTTGVWKKEGACPPDADGGIDNRKISFVQDPREPGPFELRGSLDGPELVVGRPWVLCAYVFATYVDEPLAVARTVVEPKTKPLVDLPPAVRSDGLPTRRLTCFKGYWAAYPRKMRFSRRWFRDGRRLPARGRTLRVGDRDRGHRFVCQVTARNALGKTRKRTRSFEVY